MAPLAALCTRPAASPALRVSPCCPAPTPTPGATGHAEVTGRSRCFRVGWEPGATPVFTGTWGVRQSRWPVPQTVPRNPESVAAPRGPRTPAGPPAPTCGDAGLAVVREDVAAGAGAHHGALLLPAELLTVPVVHTAQLPRGCGRGRRGGTEAASSPGTDGRSSRPAAHPTVDLPAGARGQNHGTEPLSGAQATGRMSRAGAGDRPSVSTPIPPCRSPDHVGTARRLQGPGRQTSKRSCRNLSAPWVGPGGWQVSSSALRRACALPHSPKPCAHRPRQEDGPGKGAQAELGWAGWLRAHPRRLEDPLRRRGAGTHLRAWGLGGGVPWTLATWPIRGHSRHGEPVELRGHRGLAEGVPRGVACCLQHTRHPRPPPHVPDAAMADYVTFHHLGFGGERMTVRRPTLVPLWRTRTVARGCAAW